tara:strand:- start:319 stop:639 length:321 start_codon:yes stop_codon:yes gene_type:complete
MKLTNEIEIALNSGLKFNPSFEIDNKEIKSKLLDKYNDTYNRNYVVIKTNSVGFPFIIVDSDNPYKIDSNEYLAYRLKYKEVEIFTSKYELNAWLKSCGVHIIYNK